MECFKNEGFKKGDFKMGGLGFCFFSLTIATILYKYMHICLCTAVWQRYQVVLKLSQNCVKYGGERL